MSCSFCLCSWTPRLYLFDGSRTYQRLFSNHEPTILHLYADVVAKKFEAKRSDPFEPFSNFVVRAEQRERKAALAGATLESSFTRSFFY